MRSLLAVWCGQCKLELSWCGVNDYLLMGGGGVPTAAPNKNQPNAGGVRPGFALFLMQGDAELVLTAMKQL